MTILGVSGITALYGLLINPSIIEKDISRIEQNIVNKQKFIEYLTLTGWLEGEESVLELLAARNTLYNVIASLTNETEKKSKNFIIAVTIVLSIIILIIGEIIIVIDTGGTTLIEAVIKPLIIGGFTGSISGITETIFGKNDLRGVTMGLGTGITGLQILELL